MKSRESSSITLEETEEDWLDGLHIMYINTYNAYQTGKEKISRRRKKNVFEKTGRVGLKGRVMELAETSFVVCCGHVLLLAPFRVWNDRYRSFDGDECTDALS